MPIPRAGKIQNEPLPEIIERLRQSRSTVTLIVRNSSIEKRVYIKNGQIVFATSTGVFDRLGEILVKNGTLKREDLEQALALFRQNAGLKKLGAILVSNGFVSPKDLFNALKMQVHNILFSLFLLSEGDYVVEDELPSDIIQLQINFQDLIAEMIQRMKQEA